MMGAPVDVFSMIGGLFEFIVGLCVVIAIFMIAGATSRTNELLTEMLGPLRTKEGRDLKTGKPVVRKAVPK